MQSLDTCQGNICGPTFADEFSWIMIADVVASTASTISRLDDNFFRVRLDRLTDSKKRYLRSQSTFIVHCGRKAKVDHKLWQMPTTHAGTNG